MPRKGNAMRKVLLVDDDELIRNFLKLHFESNDFQVTMAENGEDTLSVAASEAPDLIILDMNMPVKTGWETAKELKKAGAATADTPIIALTAHATHDDHVAAHEAGCDTFVEKPIDPGRLFDAAKRVLG